MGEPIEGRCRVEDEFGSCENDAEHECAECGTLLCGLHGANIGFPSAVRWECNPCIDSGALKPVGDSTVPADEHRDRERTRVRDLMRALYHRRRAKHVCVRCCSPSPDAACCEACRRVKNADARRRRAKKRTATTSVIILLALLCTGADDCRDDDVVIRVTQKLAISETFSRMYEEATVSIYVPAADPLRTTPLVTFTANGSSFASPFSIEREGKWSKLTYLVTRSNVIGVLMWPGMSLAVARWDAMSSIPPQNPSPYRPAIVMSRLRVYAETGRYMSLGEAHDAGYIECWRGSRRLSPAECRGYTIYVRWYARDGQ